MEQNVKVTFYLKKDETDVEGKCQVMAQLAVGKYSTTTFSAKMSVSAAL